ncbi:response regulator [Spirosoma aerophilum]
MTIGVPAVWLVDDDEDDRLEIRAAFDELQPPVGILTLNNGQQLMAELELNETLPKLLLLDLNMPGLTGFDLLAQLRGNPRLASLPVVIVTTSNNALDRQQSLALGAIDFITKPTSYLQLADIAQRLSRRWIWVS